jgi:hypothetical protein
LIFQYDRRAVPEIFPVRLFAAGRNDFFNPTPAERTWNGIVENFVDFYIFQTIFAGRIFSNFEVGRGNGNDFFLASRFFGN